ncbi:hypothetical protein Rleg9DRAFT_6532 [Rhizobium leguminosarum bv. trifolii WSM597]|uniref:Uncharacterized protein n=1 Tax=Rhizobium leguminosarum bv. trifolii WSM597 TaxID=754764 RepID=J0HAX5_RHILT|nr:hypothetical protein [Rhizobium leguminosarum]EJB07518.1 hypothetical protein Rleg9DRAFT_6532 [Rhizobium leguminosarum bv. trifolii WSM597]
MADKLQSLAERENRTRSKIASLVDMEIAAVLDGNDPSHSDQIVRLNQDLAIIHAAIERLRRPA